MEFNTATQLILEKYYSYNLPTTDKQKLLYDFYVINYLHFCVTQRQPKQFRDTTEDVKQSVIDADKKICIHLRDQFLQEVFYAICCELRHVFEWPANKKPLSDIEPRFHKLVYAYKNAFNPKDEEQQTERDASWTAANIAIHSTNETISTFVRLAKEIFETFNFLMFYGGKAWVGVCAGWQRLNESVKGSPNERVAIDHIYSLQHNSGSVLDKITAYHKPEIGIAWLDIALDDKRYVTDIRKLLPNCSAQLHTLANIVLKAYDNTSEHI